jgi:Ca2+ transporting ATPase
MLPGKPNAPEKFPNDDELESRLTIIGIAGIKDPLRDGIKESVAKCANAGVTVRMVTGDNIDTAIAISKEAGILPHNYEHTNDTLSVMEGKTFR